MHLLARIALPYVKGKAVSAGEAVIEKKAPALMTLLHPPALLLWLIKPKKALLAFLIYHLFRWLRKLLMRYIQK